MDKLGDKMIWWLAAFLCLVGTLYWLQSEPMPGAASDAKARQRIIGKS